MDFVKMDFEEIRKCQMDFEKWILKKLGSVKWIMKMDFARIRKCQMDNG